MTKEEVIRNIGSADPRSRTPLDGSIGMRALATIRENKCSCCNYVTSSPMKRSSQGHDLPISTNQGALVPTAVLEGLRRNVSETIASYERLYPPLERIRKLIMCSSDPRHRPSIFLKTLIIGNIARYRSRVRSRSFIHAVYGPRHLDYGVGVAGTRSIAADSSDRSAFAAFMLGVSHGSLGRRRLLKLASRPPLNQMRGLSSNFFSRVLQRFHERPFSVFALSLLATAMGALRSRMPQPGCGLESKTIRDQRHCSAVATARQQGPRSHRRGGRARSSPRASMR